MDLVDKTLRFVSFVTKIMEEYNAGLITAENALSHINSFVRLLNRE